MSVSTRSRGAEWADMWQDAACLSTDPEAFFPANDERGNATVAQRVCMGCPVRAQCLDWAIDNNVRGGIWGGLTEYARDIEKRKRRSAPRRRATAA